MKLRLPIRQAAFSAPYNAQGWNLPGNFHKKFKKLVFFFPDFLIFVQEKKLTKKLFVLIGLSAFLILSCAGGPGIVFDDSIPEEETSSICASVGNITSYNGIMVEWKKDFHRVIQVPAGDTLLEWDIIYALGYRTNTYYSGKNMLFVYNFQPQKKYTFVFDIKEGQNGLNVYIQNTDERIDYSYSGLDKHFVTFVPFLNNPGFY